jgi:hypothetical protein
MMDILAWLLPYKGALVLTALAGLLLLDRLVPVAKVTGGLMRVAKNLSLAGVNAVLDTIKASHDDGGKTKVRVAGRIWSAEFDALGFTALGHRDTADGRAVAL